MDRETGERRGRSRSRERQPRREDEKNDRDRGYRPRSRSRSRDRDRGRDYRTERSDRGRDRERSRSRDRGYGGGDRSRGQDRDRTHDARRRSRSRTRSRSPRRDRERDRDRDAGGAGGGRSSRWGERDREPPGPPGPPDPPPAAGAILLARIQSIRPFGVFVQLGQPGSRGLQALVHHTQIDPFLELSKNDDDASKIAAIEYFCERGKEVFVKVLEVQPGGPGGAPRIGGSLKAVDQATGEDLDPTNQMAQQKPQRAARGPESDDPPDLNSIHQATVTSMQHYGCFVRIPGHRRGALVKASDISAVLSFSKEDTQDDRLQAVGGMVGVGDQVYVKIVEITRDEEKQQWKVGASMRLVNQQEGRDLDPTHSQTRIPGREDPAGGPPGAPLDPREAAARDRNAPVGAAAGRVAVDGRIDWGYLKADNFGGAGATSFELVGPAEGEGDLGRRGFFGAGIDVAAAAPPSDPVGHIRSLEEALAVVKDAARGGASGRKKDKKDKDKKKKEKKSKKSKKSKKGKEDKERGSKDRRRRGGSGSDSSDSSDSDSR